MRLFYVIYVPEGEIRACIDAVRYLCNPREKHRAHITVRGPYDSPQDLGPAADRVRGEKVVVAGCGTFFGPTQNTVYLKCKCPALADVWEKKDYGSFNPHITIYDGPSREAAETLLGVLQACPVQFEFAADRLAPLVSIKGEPNFNLRDYFASDIVSQVLKESVEVESVPTLPEAQRLNYAERICIYLSARLKASGRPPVACGNGTHCHQDPATDEAARLATQARAG